MKVLARSLHITSAMWLSTYQVLSESTDIRVRCLYETLQKSLRRERVTLHLMTLLSESRPKPNKSLGFLEREVRSTSMALRKRLTSFLKGKRVLHEGRCWRRPLHLLQKRQEVGRVFCLDITKSPLCKKRNQVYSSRGLRRKVPKEGQISFHGRVRPSLEFHAISQLGGCDGLVKSLVRWLMESWESLNVLSPTFHPSS